MTKLSVCPACSAPVEPGTDQCPYCQHHYGNQPVAISTSPVLKGWTQGMDSDCRYTGSYATTEYPELSLAEALAILNRMPIPTRITDPNKQCPPALGFDEWNVSRNEDGSYFLWPDDRFCTFTEAENLIRIIYTHIPQTA